MGGAAKRLAFYAAAAGVVLTSAVLLDGGQRRDDSGDGRAACPQSAVSDASGALGATRPTSASGGDGSFPVSIEKSKNRKVEKSKGEAFWLSPRIAAGSSIAVVYRRVESPYLEPITGALKGLLGADTDTSATGDGASGGAVADFLRLSGLANTEVRWVAFSMEAVAVTGDGEKSLERIPRKALAASFAHDADAILAAFEAVRREDSPLTFEQGPGVEGAPSWIVRASGWDTEAGSGDATASVASLGGEILFVASDDATLAAQIRLYERGADADASFASLSDGGRDAFRVFVPNLGGFIAWAVPDREEAFADFDSLFTGGARAVASLREFDFAVAPGEPDGLLLKTSIRAASDEDADALASFLKVAAMKGTAEMKPAATDAPDGGWTRSVYESLRGLSVSADGDFIRIAVPVSDSGARRAATAILAGFGL